MHGCSSVRCPPIPIAHDFAHVGCRPCRLLQSTSLTAQACADTPAPVIGKRALLADSWLQAANSSLTTLLLVTLLFMLVLLTVAVMRVGTSVCHELSQLTDAIKESARLASSCQR